MNQQLSDYEPPSSAVIASRQNTSEAYRYLLAQRHLYSVAKRWANLRWIGMGVIAIAAPLVAIIYPPAAVYLGAAAGLWIFAGRTRLHHLERRTAEKAAAIQELFDQYVFDMPSSGERTITPSLEDISQLAGSDADLAKHAKEQSLIDWYPIDQSLEGTSTVAICQRANASYSDRLLRLTSGLWVGAMVLWVVILIGLAISQRLSFEVALLGVALPLLPAFLDVYEYWRGIRRAARVRRDLVRSIEDRLEANELDNQDLLVWQSQLFDLRRSSPSVPDVLYWIMRKTNERVMSDVADQLAKSEKRKKRKG